LAYALHENISLEVELHIFLTSSMDIGDWSASRHGRKTLIHTEYETERAPEPSGDFGQK